MCQCSNNSSKPAGTILLRLSNVHTLPAFAPTYKVMDDNTTTGIHGLITIKNGDYTDFLNNEDWGTFSFCFTGFYLF
jgi:hypothetical protein